MAISTLKTGATVLAGLMICTAGAYAAYRYPGHAPSRRVPAPAAAPAAEPPLAPQPPAALTSRGNGDVTLTARLDRTAVLSGSDGLAHVELTLQAADAPSGETAHRPTDMLVVLDISGSMSGDKLDHAKQALQQLIGRLQPEDRFGLVTYHSTAEVVLPLSAASPRAISAWRSRVAALQTAGGTNLSAGLDLGLAQLAHHDAARSARMLLLSDGQANEGDVSPEGLRSRALRMVRAEHVLSTLGVGDDFNEDLMTSLAQTGTGNFYYLSQVAQLGRFFDAELRAAEQSVAQAVELSFEHGEDVRVLEVSGYEMEAQPGAVRVRPGNLFAGQKRVLWVTLQLPTDRLRELAPGRFVLRYKQGEAQREQSTGELPRLACVADRERWKRGIDRELWEQNLLTEEYHKAKQQLGGAVGTGDTGAVDKAAAVYTQNRALALELGSTRVLQQIEQLEGERRSARDAAAAPEPARKLEAKQMKSRALFKRRADAYNDDPLAGM